MKIEKATKRKSKLRLALTGVTYSGKTYSALMLAHSMCKNVVIIDTENGSADLYANDFPHYDVLKLTPPYSPERYIEAIRAAENFGAEVIIIDSLSHGWTGPGGCLAMVDMIAATMKNNSGAAWGKVTPKHDALIHALTSCSTHIIATMRSKMKHDIVSDSGKSKPVKLGIGPIQRSEIEYEFTTVLNMEINPEEPKKRYFTCAKDRQGLFNNPDTPEEFTAEIGQKLIHALNSGPDALAAVAELPQTRNYAKPPATIWTAAQLNLRAESGSIYRKAKAIEDSGRPDDALMNILQKEWYELCNKYMLADDNFFVPPDFAEGMHTLLGLEKPIAIKGGYIDYGSENIAFFSDLLAVVKPSTESAPSAVGDVSESAQTETDVKKEQIEC